MYLCVSVTPVSLKHKQQSQKTTNDKTVYIGPLWLIFTERKNNLMLGKTPVVCVGVALKESSQSQKLIKAKVASQCHTKATNKQQLAPDVKSSRFKEIIF